MTKRNISTKVEKVQVTRVREEQVVLRVKMILRIPVQVTRVREEQVFAQLCKNLTFQVQVTRVREEQVVLRVKMILRIPVQVTRGRAGQGHVHS